MPDDGLLTRLSGAPVLGVSLGNVAVLRLDRLDTLAPGNKRFKLEGILRGAWGPGAAGERVRSPPGRGRSQLRQGSPAGNRAVRSGAAGDMSREDRPPTSSPDATPRRLVTFGGPWSNHLHALAAVGRERGIGTVGIVRGEAGAGDTATLADAARWGMQIVNVSRAEYRRRNEPDYLEAVRRRFAPCLVIPEGGASAAGVRGCLAIAELVRRAAPEARRVALAVGTGTTLAGVAAGLGSGWEVTGVVSLRGAVDLDERVARALRATEVPHPARWRLRHDFHCGGFARVSDPLREFLLAFERVHGVPLDPVYTAKAMYAVFTLLRSGEWNPDEPVVVIHTGGLQGRRGFPFLCPL